MSHSGVIPEVNPFSHLESFVFSFITVFRVIFNFNFEFSSSIFFFGWKNLGTQLFIDSGHELVRWFQQFDCLK